MEQPTDYAYESAQESILRPLYRRWMWDAILDALPSWLSPNAMTVISTLCCATSFALVLSLGTNRLAFLAAGVLVLAYLTLDNLDGAQARRYGRSSRLGEFLDHWLDTLNNGFVVLGACMAVGLSAPFSLVVLCVTNLAFFGVQWELRQTGVFRMGRLADVEGNTAVALLYVLLAVFGANWLRWAPIPGLPSLAVALGAAVMLPAALTLLAALRRVKRQRADFLPIALAHLLLCVWAAAGSVEPIVYLTAGFFLNPIFTTRCIWGRLLGRATGAIDWIVVIALACVASTGAMREPSASAVVLDRLVPLALAAVTLRHFTASIQMLRREGRA